MELRKEMERQLRLSPIHTFLDRPLYGSVSYSTTNSSAFTRPTQPFILSGR